MGSTELLTPLPVSVASHAPSAAAPDADFETRWAAWVARGRVHEQHVRSRFMVWTGVLTFVAVLYAFLRS
jgi:hypothetical protein